jgi:single-strand DNA-binding protein
LRIANNRPFKESDGSWGERPGYYDVTVWGKRGESCAQYLSKGSPVTVRGELRWREWEATDGSGKRQAIEVVADEVQWHSRGDGSGGGGGGQGTSDDFVPAGQPPNSGYDDDIPF